MAAASYHPRILIPKYGQTDNVKLLTTNRGLPFAIRRPNLDLKVPIFIPARWLSSEILGLTIHPSFNLTKELKLLHPFWKRMKLMISDEFSSLWLRFFFWTGYKLSNVFFEVFNKRRQLILSTLRWHNWKFSSYVFTIKNALQGQVLSNLKTFQKIKAAN